MRKKYAIIMAEWRKTMGVTYVKEVISPEELFERYPLPEAHKKLKAEKDKEIAKVFTGESDKFLVIVFGT